MCVCGYVGGRGNEGERECGLESEVLIQKRQCNLSLAVFAISSQALLLLHSMTIPMTLPS